MPKILTFTDHVEYYNELGELHREDGPAREYVDGHKEWHINGEIHRENGPAIEYENGTKEWWINGERHREDGPAVEYVNGNKWYLNDNCYGKKKPRNWKKLVLQYRAEKLLES